MATDFVVLKSISRGDRDRLVDLDLPPSEVSLVYSFWYEEYIEGLKKEERRFPGTATDIAIEAFGRADDRQHLYKNPHIREKHKENLLNLGQESRSSKVEKTREEALAARVDQVDSVNSRLLAKVDTLTEENAHLKELVKRLETALEREHLGRREEQAAMNHLFETGRRVLL